MQPCIHQPSCYAQPTSNEPAVQLLQHLHRRHECRLGGCRIAVSGPVVPDSRQPPLYKVAALPAGETLEWRLRLRLSGFGAIAIQPLLTLPARSLVLPGAPANRPI